MRNFKLVFLSLTIAFSCALPRSDAAKPLIRDSPALKELYAEIAHMDSVLFDAFNSHDIETLKSVFAEDLEFYHDLGGVTDYAQNMESFKKHFESDRKVRRELVKGSLEVYPIKDYGAVEIGSHRFYGTARGEEEKLGSEARFVQVWKKVNSRWAVTRVISYAHHEY